MFDSRAMASEFLDRPDCDPALAAASRHRAPDRAVSAALFVRVLSEMARGVLAIIGDTVHSAHFIQG